MENILDALKEELETLPLNKPEAWVSFSHKLIQAAKGQDLEEVTSALTSAANAFKGFAGRLTSSEAMNFIEVVSALLNGALGVIQGRGEDDFRSALEELKNIAASYISEDFDKGGGADKYQVLNGLAEMVIRTEPDDIDALRSLHNVLMESISKGLIPPWGRDKMAGLVDDLKVHLEEGSEGVGSSLLRIGEYLEELMNKLELESEMAEADIPLPEERPKEEPHVGKAEEKVYPVEEFQIPLDTEPELLVDFITESQDLISQAEEALLCLEADPGDMEAVGKVFRAFHTVKGTSAFLGLTPISELAHKAENLLSRVREGEIRYEGGYADLSLKALDTIKELLKGLKGALGGKPVEKPKDFDMLLDILRDPEAAGISETSGLGDRFVPRVGDILVAKGVVERETVEALSKVIDGRPLGERLVSCGVADVKDVAEALRIQRKIKTEGEVDTSIRVSTQRLDRLIDMVGELVIAHSMVAQDRVVLDTQNYDLLKKVSHTGKIVRELQDLSMSMRMVPLRATFNKMQRLVRDLAKKMGKKVNLYTEGEDTEIDRNMVDVINDPLVHMIRNAVDHGIEGPQERIQKGKPEAGTIHLCAYHSSGNVVVEVRDDGKGLDKDAILKKAIEKGLVSEGASLSEKEIFNLIFEPGFSTAKVVSDVSGRGVGMDVVKKNIERLRGQVEIHSKANEGSTFKISLPLTLAIIDGMVVKAGQERYVIPTTSIIRAVKPREQEISSILGRGQMLKLQDELMPIFRLSDILGIYDSGHDLTECLAVVVEEENRRVAIAVDELVGRQQIVIKSLGEALKGIPAISGGAIMPDGGVGLILDVTHLIKMVSSYS